MKKVIVVMSSYNGEKYIKEQIESIIKQNYGNIELLVRDDGSSDKTTDILDEYQDLSKLKWYTGEHLSVANSFIDLLRKAPEADYYSFSDQDDVWKENKISAAVKRLVVEDEKKPLFYYSATTLVDENLNFIKEHLIHNGRNDKARFLINDMSGNTVVINKKLRDLICQADCSGVSFHDKWGVQVCLALGGKVVGDKNSYILYRQHKNNTVGMEVSIKDKLDKFFRVINEGNDVNLIILDREYKNMCLPEYSKIIEIAKNKPISLIDRIKIAFDNGIVFDNAAFRLAFILKTLKGSL